MTNKTEVDSLYAYIDILEREYLRLVVASSPSVEDIQKATATLVKAKGKIERGVKHDTVVGEEPERKDKWKPTKPTWCWVWDACKSNRALMLVVEYCDHPPGAPTETDYNYRVYNPVSDSIIYCNAEPCSLEDIPDYWLEEWI